MKGLYTIIGASVLGLVAGCKSSNLYDETTQTRKELEKLYADKVITPATQSGEMHGAKDEVSQLRRVQKRIEELKKQASKSELSDILKAPLEAELKDLEEKAKQYSHEAAAQFRVYAVVVTKWDGSSDTYVADRGLGKHAPLEGNLQTIASALNLDITKMLDRYQENDSWGYSENSRASKSERKQRTIDNSVAVPLGKLAEVPNYFPETKDQNGNPIRALVDQSGSTVMDEETFRQLLIDKRLVAVRLVVAPAKELLHKPATPAAPVAPTPAVPVDSSEALAAKNAAEQAANEARNYAGSVQEHRQSIEQAVEQARQFAEKAAADRAAAEQALAAARETAEKIAADKAAIAQSVVAAKAAEEEAKKAAEAAKQQKQPGLRDLTPVPK